MLHGNRCILRAERNDREKLIHDKQSAGSSKEEKEKDEEERKTPM